MKKALIGAALLLSGSIAYLAVAVIVGNGLVGGWSTPPGRFLSSVAQNDVALPLIAALALILLGLGILAVEFFRRDRG